MPATEYENIGRTTERQSEARKMLMELYENSPLSTEEMLVNFGMYMRSSALAGVLMVDELYRQILDIPGVIMEFGVWWGGNTCLFQSLRGVYEPYNYLRKVIAFDTFEGYPEMSPEDKNSKLTQKGFYAVGGEYMKYLDNILTYHQLENHQPHIKKHELIKGDVRETLPKYFEDNTETVVALAFLDLGMYDPTKKCLETLKPHLIKGSVLVLDELGNPDMPGVTKAIKEVFNIGDYDIVLSSHLPDVSYMIMK